MGTSQIMRPNERPRVDAGWRLLFAFLACWAAVHWLEAILLPVIRPL